MRQRVGGRQLAPLDVRVGNLIAGTGTAPRLVLGWQQRGHRYALDGQELIEFHSWIKRTRDWLAYIEGERKMPGAGAHYWRLRMRLRGRFGV